jgi:hypothetical protein
MDHRAKTVAQSLSGQDIYRLLVEVLTEEINVLRQELHLPPRTTDQIIQQVRQRRKAKQQRDG